MNVNLVIIIIINVTYMVQIRIKCSKCTMSTVRGVVAYAIKNVFSRVQNTDSDMSSRSAAGKLFQVVGPLQPL